MKKCICIALAASLIASVLPLPACAQAPVKNITIQQASSMALATDYSYKKKQNEIILKKMEYTQAVASVKSRWKRLNSFSWSPLFNFKFPEKPYADEEFELNTKVALKDNEVQNLRKELVDLSLGIQEKAQTTFCDVYLLQEKISFQQSVLNQLNATLSKNEARLSAGLANPADLETLRASVKSEETALTALMRDFEAKKETLSDQTGINVSSGYRFLNPLETLTIDRGQLQSIIDYTLKNSYQVFEATGEVSIARSNLDLYKNMMDKKYGWLINYITTDLQAVRSGSAAVDYNAFLARYDKMLAEMDKPWEGRFWILFIPIPKLWIKGKLDGTRYIDNERYALYLCCMEYTDAAKNLALVTREVTSAVKNGFESLITEYNAYLSIDGMVASAQKDVSRLQELNRLGKADFTEVQDTQTAYQDAQNDRLSALTSYSQNIIAFDRLTCGAVSKLRRGESLTGDAGQGGDSYAETEDLSQPYYYITQPVTDQLFEFGIHIPADFTLPITGYELWYGGIQIGSRTESGTVLRHMPLIYSEGGKLILRVYNGEEFLDEVELSPAIPRDILRFHSAAAPAAGPVILGTYAIAKDDALGTSTITLAPDAAFAIQTYSLESTDGKTLLPSARYDVSKGFTYLSFALSDLAAIRAKLYGAGGELLYTAQFDVLNQQLIPDDG